MRFHVFFAAFAVCGCQLVGGYEEFTYAESPEPMHHACDVLPTAKDDERGLAVMARVDLADQTCLWMDRTEVTVQQYETWQEEVPADDVHWEPTWCDWKGDRTDPIGDPNDACVGNLFQFDLQPFAPRKPMRCIDFCEAEAYCRWADKHLCYDDSGVGIQGPGGFPREWMLTCTNQMTTRYPWGNDSADVCNTGQTADACIDVGGTCGASPVGEKKGCSTARGIVDLLGNVAEWVFSCNFVDSTQPLDPTACLTRGGGFDAPLEACEAERIVSSDARETALGFRCCDDLTTEEQTLLSATRR